MSRGERREKGWEVEVGLGVGPVSMLEPDTETEAVYKWWLEWDQNLGNHLTNHFLGSVWAAQGQPVVCLPFHSAFPGHITPL